MCRSSWNLWLVRSDIMKAWGLLVCAYRAEIPVSQQHNVIVRLLTANNRVTDNSHCSSSSMWTLVLSRNESNTESHIREVKRIKSRRWSHIRFTKAEIVCHCWIYLLGRAVLFLMQNTNNNYDYYIYHSNVVQAPTIYCRPATHSAISILRLYPSTDTSDKNASQQNLHYLSQFLHPLISLCQPKTLIP